MEEVEWTSGCGGGQFVKLTRGSKWATTINSTSIYTTQSTEKILYKHIIYIWSKYIFRIILWKVYSIKKIKLIITNRWNYTNKNK